MAVRRDVAEDLAAWLMVISRSRRRPVARSLIARWGVSEERAWEDAIANVLAAPLTTTAVTGPVLRFVVPDREGEAIGLLLHRRPGASPHGHLVGIVHKGAAYAIEIRDRTAVQDIGQFAAFLADIYREAARFDDQLSSRLYWLGPDGVLLGLLDILEGPPGSSPPEPFLAAMRALEGRGLGPH